MQLLTWIYTLLPFPYLPGPKKGRLFMVLCGPVTLPPRHCGSISKVSLANLEAVWGSYWAQDTHSVFNLLLYLSLGFIPYTSSLSFLFLFFLNLLWVQRFTSSTLRLVPGVQGWRRQKIGLRRRRRKKKMSRGFGIGVPRVCCGVPDGVLGASPPVPFFSPASSSHIHTI